MWHLRDGLVLCYAHYNDLKEIEAKVTDCIRTQLEADNCCYTYYRHAMLELELLPGMRFYIK